MRLPDGFATHPAAFPDTLWRAMCREVIDGDTIVIELDSGFNVYRWLSVRLLAINAPEIFHPKDDAERIAGIAAKEFLKTLVDQQPILTLTAKDKDKYGRYLAAPYYMVDGIWTSVCGAMVDGGYAAQTDVMPLDTVTPLIFR